MSKKETIIGQFLLTPNNDRDAIHIAVAPVVASMRLLPGEHIGFPDPNNTELVGIVPRGRTIGIVDPFLERPAQEGDRFYMFLYQHTITALKHHWTHPAFPPPSEVVKSDVDQREASEAWLRDFIAHADCPDYDTVLATAQGFVGKQWDDEYLHFDGLDAHGEIPNEFWDHLEVVTGRKFPRRARYFSCSC